MNEVHVGNYYPVKGSEQYKAVKELRRLKVFRLMSDDDCQYGSFDDVWYSCAHETDIYHDYALAPGQSQYDYDHDYFGGTDGMKIGTYRSAMAWMDKYEHLLEE